MRCWPKAWWRPVMYRPALRSLKRWCAFRVQVKDCNRTASRIWSVAACRWPRPRVTCSFHPIWRRLRQPHAPTASTSPLDYRSATTTSSCSRRSATSTWWRSTSVTRIWRLTSTKSYRIGKAWGWWFTPLSCSPATTPWTSARTMKATDTTRSMNYSG